MGFMAEIMRHETRTRRWVSEAVVLLDFLAEEEEKAGREGKLIHRRARALIDNTDRVEEGGHVHYEISERH